uniref:HAUS augmin like complex subunit 4 n=1 Tax=Laticauda laticaudata TaxID=8630 RepID=A0A8C5RNY0_LATLA
MVGISFLSPPPPPVFLSADCTSQLPFCSLTGNYLSANPGLDNFLMHLKMHIDSSGMSIALAQPLEEIGRFWLGEVYLSLSFFPLKSSFPALKFSETLEQKLLVTEFKWMRRMLTRCLSKQNVCLSVLGLEIQHLTKFLPPHQVRANPIPCEERGLSWMNVYDNLKSVSRLPLFLSLCIVVLRSIQVLQRCLGLLKQLAHKFRLGTQSDLDQVLIQYMEIKANALLLKIRGEEMKILSETYTPEIVNVHQMIREELQDSLNKEEINLATFRSVLSKYEILGPEFEKLVEEYTKLHEIIQNRRKSWLARLVCGQLKGCIINASHRKIETSGFLSSSCPLTSPQHKDIILKLLSSDPAPQI